MKPVRKVVIPVAGLGTRVLPATKTIPKELLPVVDRPLIDYVVAEAREAGLETIVLVTGRGKGAIEDYFDHAYELEATLAAKSKTELLDELRAGLPAAGEVIATRQQAPLGLGHAVWCAREIVGDEPFAVSLPDEIVPSRPGFLKQMLDAYARTGGNIVAVEEVDRSETSKYGVIAPKARRGDLIEMTGMVEKPAPEAAPSNFRIIGRYILQPEIFALLERQEKGAGGEIQLTDAMNKLNGRQPFHACVCKGVIHDCGSKLGWLQANIALALERPEFAEALNAYLRARLQ
ncbi:UTP--glucose-1-phosphate uridylyltransferase GalU [Amphiplicatus metriothermophilus]|uniref:UTP--glucose-1-phosphate uridylyltransferase n=1 Tax=Amphiplicatus metriothermophilus TaxID=1519374 RepID=A0A239PQ77_9PROT|nr:UTP--glucose-1-phosphate uridylyltransferase GalU [Amphiplicatus metriothermophilus]MBB5518639.1 UTP--glucose-1-phosphate uridylyltransferase [Amphiplicatus metriothermophilus]SNT72203.1 UDP-glucose pyrophosphorylase [Amphiplicatus metriothermophilus]